MVRKGKSRSTKHSPIIRRTIEWGGLAGKKGILS